MTQEEKSEILLKDISNRFPYNVWVEYKGKYYIVFGIGCGRLTLLPSKFSSITHDESPLVEEVKPCLFPLSTMTEEQKEEFIKYACYEERDEDCGRHKETYYYDIVGHEDTMYPNIDAIDWLNKNHFDYRGLIEKGLAIDATGKNIYN